MNKLFVEPNVKTMIHTPLWLTIQGNIPKEDVQNPIMYSLQSRLNIGLTQSIGTLHLLSNHLLLW